MMSKPKPVRPEMPCKKHEKPQTGYEDWLGRKVTKSQWVALKKQGKEGKSPE